MGLVGIFATQTVFAQSTYQNQIISGMEKFIGFTTGISTKNLDLHSYVASGNHADSGIERDWLNSGSKGMRLERCDWLAQNKHRYSASAVKSTKKAWGCRHSRVSKDKKKR